MKKLFLGLLLSAAMAAPAMAAPSAASMFILDKDGAPVEVFTMKEFMDRFGEVASSPTANTLLARLKTIGDAVLAPLAVTQSGTWNIATVTTVATVSSVAAVTPGVGATNLGKAEDGGHTTGDVGVQALGVRNDAMATIPGSDLDYTPFAATPYGGMIVANAPPAASVSGNASTTGTSDFQVIAAAAGGLKNYVKSCQVSNTGSTTTLVTLKNGVGGSIMGYLVAAAAGGGDNPVYEVPIATSAATALVAAAASATTTLYVSCQGFKAP